VSNSVPVLQVFVIRKSVELRIKNRAKIIYTEEPCPEALLQAILKLLIAHGYSILFSMALAERLGLPLLLTPVLLAVGVLAGTGSMSVTSAILIATIACILGDTIWFEIARARGSIVMRWLCKLSLEPDSCVRKSQSQFDKKAHWFILTSKFVPGISHIAPAAAGATGYSRGDFLLFNAAGSAAWVIVTVFTAYVSTKKLDVSGAVIDFVPVSLFIFFILIVSNIFLKAYRRRQFIREVSASRIEPTELSELIRSGDGPYIVDLRHPLDFLTDPRTVPGAVRISPDELEAHSESIPRDRDVILYCT
jgi:membrane protein DedA with SNARE-associated domain